MLKSKCCGAETESINGYVCTKCKITCDVETPEDDWKEEFRKEFINDHNGCWRPLRGLWMEDIFEFIENLIKKEREKWEEEFEIKRLKSFEKGVIIGENKEREKIKEELLKKIEKINKPIDDVACDYDHIDKDEVLDLINKL